MDKEHFFQLFKQYGDISRTLGADSLEAVKNYMMNIFMKVLMMKTKKTKMKQQKFLLIIQDH